jgi:hypothetical protein
MTLESTWESRDLPVLDAVVRYFEEHPPELIPQVFDIAEITGLDEMEAFRALQDLSDTYVDLRPVGPARNWHIVRVTDEARRAVGQWPSPESVVEQIARAFLKAADLEPDEQKRSRLRALGEGLLGFGKDVAANAVANAAMLPFTGG